jgi:hypothetical protein
MRMRLILHEPLTMGAFERGLLDYQTVWGRCPRRDLVTPKLRLEKALLRSEMEVQAYSFGHSPETERRQDAELWGLGANHAPLGKSPQS